ncbi:hypothetical protein PG993_003348 [Apiospora rasikravindrae]|uniref:Major facilitator superfamily (MFS) profile domain-containing protein n=1 Tax=Apiospora rasikravindrae TaxID=990691 RepID=A0ABR1U1X7_9PEZI
MGKPSSSSLSSASVERGAVIAAPEWTPRRQEWCCMISIAIVSVMVALDATVLVPVLPNLALELDGSTIDAFWAGTSYLLACAVFQPFIAALSDIFGRKEMLFSSVVFFTVGTALCAPIAKDFTVFFAGRTLQGIGGGGIITMGQVIYADIVPLRQRPKYFSIVLAAWAIGSVIGPLIGGVFVDKLTWKWCFYVNFPFCLIGLITVPIFVKLNGEKSTFVSKMKRVDWVGGFLFIGGMTSFLLGLSWAGIEYGWSSIQVIAPMASGTAAVFLTIVWEVRCAREPFLRPSIFGSRSAIAAYTCAFSQGFLLFCALYYVPFYFMAVRSTTPTQSGINLLPVSCCLVPGSIVVSILASRLGRFRWAVWTGLILTAVGCALLQDLDENTSTALWAAIFAVFGIGNGMMLTSVNVAIQAISKPEDCGRAAAMYAFMRTLGMSIGVDVGGTVFQNFMSSKLDDLGLPERIAHEAEAYVAQLDRMPPQDPVRIGAIQAYIHGFRGVFWVMTAMACVGCLASLLIKHHSMDKILESRFVLDGGDGAEMRENLDVLEKRLARMSKRASHHLMSIATAPMGGYSRNRSTVALSQLYGGGKGLGGDDDTKSSRALQPGNAAASFYTASVYSEVVPLEPMYSSGFDERTGMDARISDRRSGKIIPVVRNIEQAPAVSYYFEAGGRRLPIRVATDNPRDRYLLNNGPQVPRPVVSPSPGGHRDSEPRVISLILQRDGH